MRFHYDPDGEPCVTRQQAALLKGVKPATVDRWVRIGYLAPIPGCPPRRRLFKVSDVDEAEQRAYEAAVRTSGSDKRVHRAA
ncbi:hypothetical protein [Nonomuraea wenchangensis]|uniref:hypothetical protein n=1 Tax=Nonomuraea wenchangensis TaxID=568860 RepID=UPI003330A986